MLSTVSFLESRRRNSRGTFRRWWNALIKLWRLFGQPILHGPRGMTSEQRKTGKVGFLRFVRTFGSCNSLKTRNWYVDMLSQLTDDITYLPVALCAAMRSFATFATIRSRLSLSCNRNLVPSYLYGPPAVCVLTSPLSFLLLCSSFGYPPTGFINFKFLFIFAFTIPDDRHAAMVRDDATSSYEVNWKNKIKNTRTSCGVGASKIQWKAVAASPA